MKGELQDELDDYILQHEQYINPGESSTALNHSQIKCGSNWLMHAINKRADPTSSDALLSTFGGGIIYITCRLLPSTSDEFVGVRIQPILHRIWIVPIIIKYVVRSVIDGVSGDPIRDIKE
jgi:hypothetical protein